MAQRPDPPPDAPTLLLVAGWLDKLPTDPAVVKVARALPRVARNLGQAVSSRQGYGEVCVAVRDGELGKPTTTVSLQVD